MRNIFIQILAGVMANVVMASTESSVESQDAKLADINKQLAELENKMQALEYLKSYASAVNL